MLEELFTLPPYNCVFPVSGPWLVLRAGKTSKIHSKLLTGSFWRGKKECVLGDVRLENLLERIL